MTPQRALEIAERIGPSAFSPWQYGAPKRSGLYQVSKVDGVRWCYSFGPLGWGYPHRHPLIAMTPGYRQLFKYTMSWRGLSDKGINAVWNDYNLP